MQNISDDLKYLFKTDRLPFRNEKLHKNVRMVFDDFTIDNERIKQESLVLTDSLCSDDDLIFGSAESAELKITVANVPANIVGSLFDLYLDVYEDTGSIHTMQLGEFRVKSAVRKDDLWFRDLTCYDRMNDLDVDVKSWYDSLTFPITVKDFRDSFCAYVGIEQEEDILVNDDMLIQKTVDVEKLTGRDVMRSIGEVNASCPHIKRNGKLAYVTLSNIGLYPSETLYPSDDLYPSEAGDVVPAASYETIRYEDYSVEAITGIRIRETDDDLGTAVGTSENPYIITENFLLYGKNADELREIGNNIFSICKEKFYIPFESTGVGLPYVEVGDSLSNMTEQSAVESFVFSLTLSGIQALISEFSATGNQYRENTASLATQIDQLNGKYFKLIADTDGLRAEIADTKEDLYTEIDAVAGQLDLKVSKGDVSSQISLEPGTVTLSGNRLVVNSTNFQLDENGNAVFSGTLSAGISIYSPSITGGYFSTSGANGSCTITDGEISIVANNYTTGMISIAGGSYTSYLKSYGLDWNQLGVNNTAGYYYDGWNIPSYLQGNASMLWIGSSCSFQRVGTGMFYVSTTGGITLSGGYCNIYSPSIVSSFSSIPRDVNECAVCNDGSNLASASYVRNQIESDERLKIITGEPAEDLIEAMRDIEVVQFQYIPGAVISDNDDGRQRFGIKAQQAMQAFETHGFNDSIYSFIKHQEPAPYSAPYILDGDELKPDYMQFVPALLYWCQQLTNRIEQLEARV